MKRKCWHARPVRVTSATPFHLTIHVLASTATQALRAILSLTTARALRAKTTQLAQCPAQAFTHAPVLLATLVPTVK